MTTAERPAYKVIGTRPVRPDGVEKVTGKALYGADIRPSGLIHGRVLRSPHAHATIRRIDTSAAEKVPGVFAVVTHQDLPPHQDRIAELGEGGVMRIRELCDNVLASSKVLYRGHAIAGVAAINGHVAEEALAKIVVEYDILPPVLDVRDAMRPDAPLLNPEQRTKEFNGEMSANPSNIASHIQYRDGDIDTAFAEADVVVEREYTTKMVHQGYIEPHNATASWNADGSVTLWTSTQGSFAVRAQLSDILAMSPSKVRVIPLEIGGGFGGKISVTVDPVSVLLARKAGRPVKTTMNRTDVFEASGPTGGTSIRLKMGAKDGKITAVKADMAYEAGAYPGSSVMAGCTRILSVYDVPNFLIDGYDVLVNKPKNGAYRAPGVPAAAFAGEQAVDEVARFYKTDPITFRLENAAKEGTRQTAGPANGSIGNEEVMLAAMASAHWQSPIEGPNRGRGFAVGSWGNIGFNSCVSATVNSDGTVQLIEGAVDIGGTRAALAMQLAETLSIPYEDVHPIVVDTDSIGYTDVTGGSRTAFAGGKACYEAGLEIQRQMRLRAAREWKAPIDDVKYDNGIVSWNDGTETKKKTFKQIAARPGPLGPIVGQAAISAQGAGAAYAAHIVDVEVDPDTGKVTILRYTALQDVGTAIHPSYVEGQIQGGAVQGIGWALNEEYFYDESGRMANSSFLDYRIPTALDVPMIDTIIVEKPNPGSPYGVRGVGEAPITPPLAAIANAIYEATGHRFTSLPISPRRVVEELQGVSS